MRVEAHLSEMGIVLPEPPVPVANYVLSQWGEKLLFLSGQGPMEGDGRLHTGKVGLDVSAQEAYVHARLAAIRLLASAKAALGDLDRVSQVVKLLGMVNAAPDFKDLLVAAFGEAGRHARSAVGMGSLPGNMTVEVEAIFEISSRG